MRCENLGSEQFRDHFYAPSRPCVIAGATADWPALAAESGARLHLYGKAEARPGRKMGHVNRIRPRAAD